MGFFCDIDRNYFVNLIGDRKAWSNEKVWCAAKLKTNILLESTHDRERTIELLIALCWEKNGQTPHLSNGPSLNRPFGPGVLGKIWPRKSLCPFSLVKWTPPLMPPHNHFLAHFGPELGRSGPGGIPSHKKSNVASTTPTVWQFIRGVWKFEKFQIIVGRFSHSISILQYCIFGVFSELAFLKKNILGKIINHRNE